MSCVLSCEQIAFGHCLVERSVGVGRFVVAAPRILEQGIVAVVQDLDVVDY